MTSLDRALALLDIDQRLRRARTSDAERAAMLLAAELHLQSAGRDEPALTERAAEKQHNQG